MDVRVNTADDPSTYGKNFVNFGPVGWTILFSENANNQKYCITSSHKSVFWISQGKVAIADRCSGQNYKLLM